MTEKKFDFSIIMEDDNDAVPDDIWDGVPVREDRKGPKTIAILIFIGGLIILFQAYSDFLNLIFLRIFLMKM